MEIKDIGQFIFWGASIVGIGFAVWKGLGEFRRSREQREQELRWKKADAARSLIHDLFNNPRSQNAAWMLDYDGRTFDIGERKIKVTREILRNALRTDNLESLNDVEFFIRDCFDDFFFLVDLMNHAWTSKLIDLDDVKFHFDYYVIDCMKREATVLDAYMERYGYKGAMSLFKKIGESSSQ